MNSFGRAIWERPGWATAAFLLGWGAWSVVWGEHVPRNEGFGWDGCMYRTIAQCFPDPMPDISLYSARRCLPSVVVRSAVLACGATLTGANIFLAFAVMNVALFLAALAALMAACRTLGTGTPGKWLLCLGYFCTYAHLKQYHYAPVHTDGWATALSAFLVLSYLRRWQLGVAVGGFVGAFVWPTLPQLAALLFLLPARSAPSPTGPAPDPPIRSSVPGRALAALAALALLGLLVDTFWLRPFPGPQPDQVIRSLLPLSCVLAAGYLYLALAPLLAPGLPSIARAPGGGFVVRVPVPFALDDGFVPRLAGVAVGFCALAVANELLRPLFPAPEPFTGALMFVRIITHVAVSKPLFFAVVHVSWFGPMVVLAALNWRPICREIRGAGTGLVLYTCAGLLLTVNGESRQALTLFPVVALFAARVAERRAWSPGRVLAFGAIGLVTSRVWLSFNPVPWPETDALYDYPMQLMMMNHGYLTNGSYLLLAGLGLATVVAVVAVAPRGATTPARAPAGAPGGWRPFGIARPAAAGYSDGAVGQDGRADGPTRTP